MREIKFRAFDRELNKWLYFTLEELTNGRRRVRLKNWCEYTGLKDKNGKEIYEGDVIEHKYYYDHGQSGEYKEFIQVVKWDDTYSGFMPMCATKEYNFPRGKIEVIGNIYENPELLEKPT